MIQSLINNGRWIFALSLLVFVGFLFNLKSVRFDSTSPPLKQLSQTEQRRFEKDGHFRDLLALVVIGPFNGNKIKTAIAEIPEVSQTIVSSDFSDHLKYFFRLSPDESLVLLQLRPDTHRTVAESRLLNNKIRKTLNTVLAPWAYSLVGGPATQVEISNANQKTVLRLALPLGLAIFIVLLLLTGSLQLTATCFLFCLFSVVVSGGIFEAWVAPLHAEILSFLPLIVCLLLINPIFLLDRLRHQPPTLNFDESISKTYHELIAPLTLVSLFLGLGVGVFCAITQTPALKIIGCFILLTLAVGFVSTLVILPPWLSFVRLRRERSAIEPLFFPKTFLFSYKRPLVILSLFAIPLFYLLPKLERLQIGGSSPVFAEGNRYQKSIDQLNTHLGNAYPISLKVEPASDQANAPLNNISQAMGLENWAWEEGYAKFVLSPFSASGQASERDLASLGNRLKKLNWSLLQKRSEGFIEVDRNGRLTGLEVLFWPQTQTIQEQVAFLGALEIFERNEMKDFVIRARGPYILEHLRDRRFAKEFLIGFSCLIALGFIFSAFFFRRPHWALGILTSTLLPLALLSGVMGLFEAQLGRSWLLFPGLVFSILYAPCIYLLWYYHQGGKLIQATRKMARPMATMAALFIVMFCFQLFSPVAAQREMGLYAALAIVFGLFTNTFVLPALMGVSRSSGIRRIKLKLEALKPLQPTK